MSESLTESSQKILTGQKRHRSRKGKDRADDSFPLPQNIPLPASPSNGNGASSSRLPPAPLLDSAGGAGPVKKESRRKTKQREKGLLGDASAVAIPGPSSKGENSGRARDRGKKRESRRHRDHTNPEGDDQSWRFIPVAQNETSRVPPVWSRDGR
jgi:hypothetical protein